jgi:hypothetical protein
MLRRHYLAALAFAGLVVFAGRAHASPLPPGSVLIATDVIPDITGETLVAHTSGAFVATPGGSPAGTYDEWVYRTATGTLDFAYQFHVTTGIVESTSHSDFTGATIYDAGYIAGTGVSPDRMSRTADGSIARFNFVATPVAAGQTSSIDVLRTTSKFYTLGTYTFQDGGAVGVVGFSPAATPEPSSVVLAGLGAVGLVGYGFRRRKARTA